MWFDLNFLCGQSFLSRSQKLKAKNNSLALKGLKSNKSSLGSFSQAIERVPDLRQIKLDADAKRISNDEIMISKLIGMILF